MEKPQLYELLPEHARFFNSELGLNLLEHLCVAIQPEFDRIYRLLDNLYRYHDPDFCQREFLPALGQWVGLSTLDEHYLGLGINPNWPESRQRELIKEAIAYWRIKGTPAGIKKAIELWLWKAKGDSKLTLSYPFGRTPSSSPPNWWSYKAPYGSQLLRTWQERRSFGDGAYPGTAYRPNWKGVRLVSKNNWNYATPWGRSRLESFLPQKRINTHTYLNASRPWLYFEEVPDNEWNDIFPDIFTLNPEIFPALDRPTVLGWLKFEGLIAPYPLKEKPIEVITKRKIDLRIDGWRWNQRYYSPPSKPRVVTTITESSEAWQGRIGGSWYQAYGRHVDRLLPLPEPPRQGAMLSPFRPGLWFIPYGGYTNPRILMTRSRLNSNYGRCQTWTHSFFRPRPYYRGVKSVVTRTKLPGEWVKSTPYTIPVSVTASDPQAPLPPASPQVNTAFRPYGYQSGRRNRKIVFTTTVPGIGCRKGISASIPIGEETVVTQVATPGSTRLRLLSTAPQTLLVKPEKIVKGIYTGTRYGRPWLSFASLSIAIREPSNDPLLQDQANSLAQLNNDRAETYLSPLDTEPFALNLLDINLDVEASVAKEPGAEAISIETEITLDEIDWNVESLKITSRIRQDTTLTRRDSYYAPLRRVPSVIKSVPARLLIDQPNSPIALFSRPYTRQYSYYKAFPGKPTVTKVIPLLKRVSLCNIPCSYSRQTIIFYQERVETIIPQTQPIFPDLEQLGNANHWQCILTTGVGLVISKPQTLFWCAVDHGVPSRRERSLRYEPGRYSNLYLEFVFQIGVDTMATERALVLDGTTINVQRFKQPLNFPELGLYGFRLIVPTLMLLDSNRVLAASL